MAIEIKHTFVSAKGDGSDATLVRPSNWNAVHSIVMATNRILGRLTAGPGDAEELPVTSYMIGLLNTADYAALAVALGLPTTGDAKLTYKTTADVGWIMANDGTIGDAASSASVAAANTQALFTHFYNTFSDAVCPLQTSTGVGTTRGAQGAAAVAYSAHCRMVIPKNLGRAILVAGSGAGLSARGLAGIGGAESHQLLPAEVPDHVHNITPTGSINNHDVNHYHTFSWSGGTGGEGAPDHLHNLGGTTGYMNQNNVHSHGVNGGVWGGTTHSWVASQVYFDGPVGASAIGINAVDINHTHNLAGTTGASDRGLGHSHSYSGSSTTSYMVSNNVHGHTFTGNNANTSGAGFGWGYHNNMQPWTAWNIMIRL